MTLKGAFMQIIVDMISGHSTRDHEFGVLLRASSYQRRTEFFDKPRNYRSQNNILLLSCQHLYSLFHSECGSFFAVEPPGPLEEGGRLREGLRQE